MIIILSEGLAKCEYKTEIKSKSHIQLHPPWSFELLACLSSTCKEVEFGTSRHFDNTAGLWVLSISVPLYNQLTIWKFRCLPRYWCNRLDPYFTPLKCVCISTGISIKYSHNLGSERACKLWEVTDSKVDWISFLIDSTQTQTWQPHFMYKCQLGALLLNKYYYGKTCLSMSQLILTCMVNSALTLWQAPHLFPFLTLLDNLCCGANLVILWWNPLD
jgi:hypothetical protein